MKAIETTGTIDEKGQINLDSPLTISKQIRVKVIVLISEEEDRSDELTESPQESFSQGWQDAMKGNISSVSQLWEGIDAE